MIKKLRWRYYCEHCGKGGASGGCMARHEKRCTLNPNRECGLCALWAADDQTARGDLSAARSLLPCADDFKVIHDDLCYWEWPGLDDAVAAVFQQVRDACNNCPACILAALRQRHIPVKMINSFHFDNESKARIAEYNAMEIEGRHQDIDLSYSHFYGSAEYQFY